MNPGKVARITRVVNATWQWGHDARLLRAVAEGATVVAVVEGRTRTDDPVHVRAILGILLWQVAQVLRSGALAGCALAVRRTAPVRLVRWRSLKASAAGAGVQQRNLLHSVLVERVTAQGQTTVYEDHLIVVHNPLEHTGRQDDAVRAVRARRVRVQQRATTVRAKVAARLRQATGRPVVRRVVRWMVVGDFNRPHDAERRALGGLHSAGHDVMGVVWGDDWGHLEVTSAPYPDTDHHVLTIKEHR
jgi:hypothetical protein